MVVTSKAWQWALANEIHIIIIMIMIIIIIIIIVIIIIIIITFLLVKGMAAVLQSEVRSKTLKTKTKVLVS